MLSCRIDKGNRTYFIKQIIYKKNLKKKVFFIFVEKYGLI